jgi:NAD(P)-dependent dehydrogenase (short-subunit alcohol dehydrogenase family)
VTGRFALKNIIITGGGAGIGLASARLFGRDGARVSIFDSNQAHLEKAANELLAENIKATAYCLDVSDAQAVSLAFKQVAHRNGAIHVLVNNAGIAEFSGLQETSIESWQRIIAVNVTGTFLCSQAVIPLMKSCGGAIVNIASIAGIIGIPEMPAYCASKAAVIGLTRQMAVDLTPLGIRINCVCPGRIAGTELDRWIMAKDNDAITRAKIAKYPIGRFGRPEEVAQAILYLAGDESSFISGTTLTIDGGMTVS